MTGGLTLRNRQRTRLIDLPGLREIIQVLLVELLDTPEFDLSVHLVNAREMAQLNHTHLGHEGSTDVITLDYADPACPGELAGELFVCIDEAVLQGGRFRTTWQAELARYVIHGLLHLKGHDDLEPKGRRRMRRKETRLLGELNRRFSLSKLERNPKLKK